MRLGIGAYTCGCSSGCYGSATSQQAGFSYLTQWFPLHEDLEKTSQIQDEWAEKGNRYLKHHHSRRNRWGD